MGIGEAGARGSWRPNRLGVIPTRRAVRFQLVLLKLPMGSLHRSLCGVDGNRENGRHFPLVLRECDL